MKKLKTAIALFLVLLMAFSLLAGCGQQVQKTKEEVSKDTQPVETKPATPEKEEPPKETPKSLTIYTGMQEDHSLKAVQEFEKKTGIKTTFVRMSGGEILGRIRAEKEKRGQLLFGGYIA